MGRWSQGINSIELITYIMDRIYIFIMYTLEVPQFAPILEMNYPNRKTGME